MRKLLKCVKINLFNSGIGFAVRILSVQNVTVELLQREHSVSILVAQIKQAANHSDRPFLLLLTI